MISLLAFVVLEEVELRGEYWQELHISTISRISDLDAAHIDRNRLLLRVEVDLCNSMTSDQMEVGTLASDWTVVRIGRIRTRLILGRQRDEAVEDTIAVPSVGLRLRGKTDGVPAPEEVLCGAIAVSTAQR